ncbi:MAG: hypothetical protein H0X47_06835 [Nitrospirales bacterium]|nr:hypothetical protein [Nitrospirales bacterium]
MTLTLRLIVGVMIEKMPVLQDRGIEQISALQTFPYGNLEFRGSLIG